MSDWHQAGVHCPSCQSRSTWCAPKIEDAARGLEYICVACNGRFYLRGMSFVGFASYHSLSEWDRRRVQELRRVAGCGANSAVGAFG